MMTSRERILRAMSLNQPDRVPMSPIITAGWIDAAGEELTKTFLRETDPILVIAIASDIPLGRYGEENQRTIREGNRITRIIPTKRGDLVTIQKKDLQTTWVEKHFFEQDEDVEKFMSIPYTPSVPRVSEWQKWQKRIGDDGIVLADIPNALMLPGGFYNPQEFMLNYVLNKGLIVELIQTAQERILSFVKNCLQEGINQFRIVGAELAAPPLMGPSAFDELVAPFDSELISLIHSAQGIVHVHMHGAIRNMLEQVAALGANSLDPLEAAPGGNVDLAEAKRRIGDKVCLVGNLDDLGFIADATYEELRDRCQESIEAAAAGGGYILGGTSSGIFTPKLAKQWLVMAKIAQQIGVY